MEAPWWHSPIPLLFRHGEGSSRVLVRRSFEVKGLRGFASEGGADGREGFHSVRGAACVVRTELR